MKITLCMNSAQQISSHVILPSNVDDPEPAGLQTLGPSQHVFILSFQSLQIQEGL